MNIADSFLPFGMNWFDVVVILAIGYGIWAGVRGGLSREIIVSVGVIVALVCAVFGFRPAGDWLLTKVKLAEETGYMLAFMTIVVLVIGVALLVQRATHKNMKRGLFSSAVESVGGGLAGAIRLLVVMTVVVVVACFVRSPFWHEQVAKNSRFGSFVAQHTPEVTPVLEKTFPEKLWFMQDLKRREDPDVETPPQPK